MNRTQVWIRIGALVIVAALGLSYIAFNVLGYRLGAQPFAVTVYLPRGGGLYSDGFVTYRGVDVGRITSLSLSSGGAVATLAISPGTRIPADAVARVHDLSVAGEQYLDLVPPSGAGPLLHAGSVIGRRHTVVPVSVFQLLGDAGQLIASVNAHEVQTITTALGTGLAGTGPDLRSIAVAAEHLVTALQAARDATVTIIDDAGPVLATAQASGSDITSFSQSLATISAQLAASNADITAIVDQGVPTELALQRTLQADGPGVTQLIKNLDALSSVAFDQQAAVVALLQQLPEFVNRIAAAATGGSVAVSIYYNSANTVCPYVSGPHTAEPTAATGSPTLTNACAFSAPDLLQRGAGTAPVSSGG